MNKILKWTVSGIASVVVMFLVLAVNAGWRMISPTDSTDPNSVKPLFKGADFEVSKVAFIAAGFQDPLDFYRFETSSAGVDWLNENYRLFPEHEKSSCKYMEVPGKVSMEGRRSIVPSWWHPSKTSMVFTTTSELLEGCCYFMYFDKRESLVYFQRSCT